MTPIDALKLAIERAGGQNALARLIGCAQPSVFRMVQKGRASTPYVLKIEQETGVSRHDLDPNIYPRDNTAA